MVADASIFFLPRVFQNSKNFFTSYFVVARKKIEVAKVLENTNIFYTQNRYKFAYYVKMLRRSTVPHEYYLGDLPGRLQYAKDAQEILDCQLVDDAETRGYQLCEHSADNLRRALPISQQKNNWKILLMMRSTNSENEIWQKTALLNKTTGKIALLTSTNSKANLETCGARSVKTVDGEWFVGHYRMSAPIVFWAELKNRLLY